MLDPTAKEVRSPLAESLVSSGELRGVGSAPDPSLPTLRPAPAQETTYEAYQILGEQGTGGLGRVLRARDLRLGRLVALKELLDPSPEARARFLREVMLSARLQHPSIISIYEVGEKPDGSPFYAMKLVEGSTLGEVIAKTPSFEARLSLLPHVLAVAEAMAYAHEQGIIHRDLKPSNVVIGEFGETVVIDWGLAKDLRSGCEGDDYTPPSFGTVLRGALAATGGNECMGTPAYMAPEQTRGQSVDARADVFALGGLLYHVLAQQAPYAGDLHAEVVSRIIAGTPVPLEERVANVPADLAAIVKKAMAPAREDRYPNAKELATDLARYLAGQLVSAHRYSPGLLVKRFAHRHRRALTLAASFLALLALLAVVSVKRVVTERDRAEARTLELTMTQARSALDRDPSEALAWLKTYPPTGPAWSEVAPLAAEAAYRGVARYRHHLFPTSWVRDMAISSDGRFVAACDEMQNVAVVDVESGALVHRFRHPGTARRVTFGQDDRTVVAGGEDGVLLVFDRASQSTRELRGTTTGGIRTLATLPNGDVVSGGKDGFVRVFDLSSGTSRIIGKHYGTVDRVTASANGELLATVGSDDKMRVWDVQTGNARGVYELAAGPRRPRVVFAADNRSIAILEPSEKITLYEVDRGPVRSFIGHDITSEGIDLSPDGKTIAAAGLDRAVRVWDLETGALRTFHGHLSDVVLVRFSPDGSQLASTGVDGDIRIWDTKSGRDVRRLRGSVQSVDRLAWSSSTRSLVSADQGGFLRVWRLDDDPQRILAGHSADIVPMIFSPHGTRIATGSNDKTLRLWDVATGTSVPWYGHTSSVRYLAFVGDKVASAGLDQCVRLWSQDGTSRLLLTSERPITELVANGTHVVAATQGGELSFIEIATGAVKIVKAHAGAIQTLARSVDGHLVASGGDDHVVRLWDPSNGELRGVLDGHEAELGEVAFSPDGTRLAAASKNGTIRVWDTRAFKAIGVLRGHDKRIASLAFSPDGTSLASGSNDRSVRVWDLTTMRERGRVLHEQHVSSVRFSPDGALLASGSNDRTVRVWDSRTLALRAMHHHDNVVTSVAFAPDGRTLASAGWDQVVRLWPVTQERMLPTDSVALRRYLDGMTNQVVARASE